MCSQSGQCRVGGAAWSEEDSTLACSKKTLRRFSVVGVTWREGHSYHLVVSRPDLITWTYEEFGQSPEEARPIACIL